MGSTLKHFLITFFTLSLWIIVFVNFLGWSGIAPSFAVGYDSYNWGPDKYFGFSSIMRIFSSLENIQSNENFSFFSGASIINTLKHLASVAIGNIPQVISSIQNFINVFNQGNPLDVLWNGIRTAFDIMQLFLQPIAFVLWSFVLIIQVLGLATELITILVIAVAGNFNSNVPDISSTIDWTSYYIWPL